MDDPSLPIDLHVEALDGLARLNRFSAAPRPLWLHLAPLAARRRDRPLQVLDLACGDASVVAPLARRAISEQIDIQWTACDISAVALDLARARAEASGVAIEFIEADAVHHQFDRDRFDVVMCSLFLHHLDERDALQLLQNARRTARELVLVSDLERSPLNLALIAAASRALTRSPVVHVDAVRSARAAFTREELAQLLASAGLRDVRVVSAFPCRMLGRGVPA